MLSRGLVLFDRVLYKFKRAYYRKVFLVKTGNENVKNCNVYSRVNILNNNITIGDNVTFFHNVTFFGDGKIMIGDNVAIGQDVIIYASADKGGVSIGNNTMIAAHSYIIDCDHGLEKGIPIYKQKNTVGTVKIGNDVWIGDNCTILKHSVIEDGAIVGAKSLVKGKVAQDTIVVGIPAKEIKQRKRNE
ncbi:MAG: acyltransferase [Lacrimispora sp.]|uniref:acyltransferase n=1 Tax=Lacrimispora sp. TaxID=2719234 RepID=UPI0039E49318